MRNRYWNSRKCICAGLLVLVLLFSGIGCQQQKKNDEKNQASDRSQEENAGNDQASDAFWQRVQEEIEEKTEMFSNGDNSYCITTQEERGETVNVLTQQKADGTPVQNHAVDHLESILQVTDTYVYYETWEGGAALSLFWCVPIQKTEDGDQLIWEKKEFLLKNFIDIFYVTDSYVIYQADEGIYKLDLQKKKSLPVTVKKEQLDGSVVRDRERKTVVLDGKIFVLDRNNMYSLEPDSGVVEQIYAGVNWKDDIFYENAYLVSDDNSVYFSCDNETIWQYSPNEDQAVRVITEENFSEKLKEFGLKEGKKFKTYCISQILLYQERIYFWLRDGDEDEKYYGTAGSECLLSAPVSDLSQIQNESALTDYLNTWGTKAEPADKVANTIDIPNNLNALNTQVKYVHRPYGIAGIVEDKLILKSILVVSPMVSSIHTEYSAAYDLVSKQMIERSGIKKAYDERRSDQCQYSTEEIIID